MPTGPWLTLLAGGGGGGHLKSVDSSRDSESVVLEWNVGTGILKKCFLP